ncbi:hypothetical protein DPEC_G00368000 [Dallia pectoralis]|nr:hypothetical protein DPEC_G00368000 [Dallia pectoralis]
MMVQWRESWKDLFQCSDQLGSPGQISWATGPDGDKVFIGVIYGPHTLYAFEIHAINGVTNKSPYPAQHVSINITTNQAAPSLVPIMHQVSSTMKSFTLVMATA